jgi:hypothetical protein
MFGSSNSQTTMRGSKAADKPRLPKCERIGDEERERESPGRGGGESLVHGIFLPPDKPGGAVKISRTTPWTNTSKHDFGI